MIKNLSSLEVKKEDRVYVMYVENSAPLGEVFDALSQMRSYVFERIKAVEEESKKPAQEQPPEPSQA